MPTLDHAKEEKTGLITSKRRKKKRKGNTVSILGRYRRCWVKKTGRAPFHGKEGVKIASNFKGGKREIADVFSRGGGKEGRGGEGGSVTTGDHRKEERRRKGSCEPVDAVQERKNHPFPSDMPLKERKGGGFADPSLFFLKDRERGEGKEERACRILHLQSEKGRGG